MMGFNRRLARNIGNQVTGPAASRTSMTALGRNTPPRLVKHVGGGSSAGLNAHRVARIESNMAGYPTQANKVIKSRPRPPALLDRGGIFLPDKGKLNLTDHRNPKYLV